MIILWDSSEMEAYIDVIDGQRREHISWQAGRTLARDMLAFLRDTLQKFGYEFSDITGIGVLRGPGSYTGLRIGLTVLNTMAHAEKIPIVGATGEEWRETCERRLADGENDEIVLPEYGGEARVTSPRK